MLRVSTLKTSGVQRFGYFLPGDVDAELQEPHGPVDDGPRSLLQSLATFTPQVSRVGMTGRLKLSALRMACDVVFDQKGCLSKAGRLRQKKASIDLAEFIAPVSLFSEFEALPQELQTISYMLARLRSPTASAPHPVRLIAIMAWLFGTFEKYVETVKWAIETDNASEKVHVLSVPSDTDKRQAFVERVKGGEAVSSAAIHVGVDPAVGIGWAKAENISVSRRRKRIRGDLLVKLRRRLRAGESKQHIAEALGVSVSSVSRLLYSDPALADAWKDRLYQKNRDVRRGAWLRLISTHGHLGSKLLREMEPAVYAWLYRNDRSWLDAQRGKIATKVAQPTTRVDWQQRDDDLVADLREAVDLIARSPENQSVSIGRLCQLVPDLKRRLAQTNRLPQTKRFLDLTTRRGGSPDSNDPLPLT
jgi:hypothetical protein